MRLGIDLGGTKIEAIALDDGGTTLCRRRIPAPRDDYDATLRAIAGLVAAVEAETGERGTVGVGMPGTLSPATGSVRNANSTWLNDRPLDRDLAAALGRPVRCVNDANCLAVSEAVDGAGAGHRVVFAAILGTGVGGGIALDGQVHIGPNAIGGEWGHNPLPWPGAEELPGAACFCGRHGCIETWVSGTGLADDHRRVTGQDIAGPEIVARAEAGDAACEGSFRRYESRLARSLASVANLLDPDVIVLGGGMSNVDRIYRTVPPLLARYVFGRDAATPLRKAAHGDSSGVRGAAWLWPALPDGRS